AAERRQKREPDVDVVEEVSPDESADADRRSPLFALDHVEPEAVSGVRVDRTLADVFARVVQVPDAAIADEPQPRRIVDELENELRVVGGEAPQDQAVRLEHLSPHGPPAT